MWRAGQETGGHGRSASWSGVGVRRGFLHVAQRHAGIKGGSDERVAQRVWPDPLGDPGTPGDPAHDPPSGVAVEPLTGGLDEDRPVAAFTDGQVDRPGDSLGQRHRRGLAALAQHQQGAMTTLETEGCDVRSDRLGDPQPVQR